MEQKVTRQQQEEYALKKYIENQGGIYDPAKAVWPPLETIYVMFFMKK